MMLRQRFFLTLFVFLLAFPLFAAKKQVEHVEPPFWWAGMASPNLQLLVHAPDIAETTVFFDYPGVDLVSVELTDNANFLFINLELDRDVAPGAFEIQFLNFKGKVVAHYLYELKKRVEGSANRAGFDESDLVYLVMPDRFANGNPENDNVEGMLESANRSNKDGRHGGDIAGIENHLDYISDLGMTALWINPLQENNQPIYSYHGYAISDYYKVDPRFGTNAQYKQLVDAAHENGLKVIQDMVFNHCGIDHWWLTDLPDSSWIHFTPEFMRSNFRASTISDPYASEADRYQMTHGWFDTNMPDLNQSNSLVENYLIQNSIWWIEYLGLDGIRQDTYIYPDKEMMRNWCLSIKQEYPNFNIVGEVWSEKEGIQHYWLADANNRDGYNSELMMLTDFPLYVAITKSFNGEKGWRVGAERVYYTLAQDQLYAEPQHNLTFIDNHDVGRFFTVVGNSIEKYKQGVAMLFTLRGMPQFFYGSEILMEGGGDHGTLRADMPGGWLGDSVNIFEEQGLTEQQSEAYFFVKNLANWRKNCTVAQRGALMQFVPQDGIYVYFRYNDSESVMVVVNYNDSVKQIELARFKERLSGFTSGTEVITGSIIESLERLMVPANGVFVIELKR